MSTIVTSQKHDLTEKKRRLSRAEMRDIMDLSLWAGQLQLQYGVDTERAETTIHRLGTGLGCDWLDAFVSPNAIVISTMSGDEFRTRTRRLVRFGGVDMNMVAAVNDLWYQADAQIADRAKIRRELEQINAMPKLYNRWLVVLLVGLACAAFSRLFGGDWAAFGMTWAAASVAMMVRQMLTHRYFNPYLVVVATAFVATMVAAVGVMLQLGSNPQIALAASVLLLVPGVPLINSSKDLLQGHLVTGIVRGATGGLVSLSIALGIGIAITILPVTLVWDSFVPPSNLFADAFWAALAATGFAVLFNVPYRTLIGCAACGALGHATRTLLLNLNLQVFDNLALDSLIGAMVVGTLGYVLARLLQLPSSIFTVSGIIPMIPGTYAFRTMLGILQLADIIDIDGTVRPDLSVLNDVIFNGLTTGFVLAALAIGITTLTLLFRRSKPVL